jgi:hypothetical protein
MGRGPGPLGRLIDSRHSESRRWIRDGRLRLDRPKGYAPLNPGHRYDRRRRDLMKPRSDLGHWFHLGWPGFYETERVRLI